MTKKEYMADLARDIQNAETRVQRAGDMFHAIRNLYDLAEREFATAVAVHHELRESAKQFGTPLERPDEE